MGSACGTALPPVRACMSESVMGIRFRELQRLAACPGARSVHKAVRRICAQQSWQRSSSVQTCQA